MLPMAVVVGEFPSLSETFILREIEALQAAGLNPRLYALRAGPRSVMHAQAYRWLPAVRYLSLSSTPCTRVVDAWRELMRHDRAGGRRLMFRMLRTGCRFPGMLMRIVRHMHAVAALARAVREDQIGYMHAHFATLPTEIVWAASLYSECPFGFSTHAHDLYTQQPALLRYKMDQAVFVSACTDTHVRLLRELASPRRHPQIKRFYHGITIPANDPPCSPQSDLILAVGRLVPKKAFDMLLAACAVLSQRGIDYTCELVGDGPEKQCLEKIIHDSGLEKRVIMTGAVSQEQLPEYYRKAMLTVITSRILPNGDRDGIPNVLLEAMARGIPVIATDTPTIREVIRHNINGCLVSPNNPEALANAIERLLADRKLRVELGRQAAATVRNNFDARRHAHDLVTHLRTLLNVPDA